ncbi:hypothetical protein JTB14_011140 [Gonioctena quinquepunctata]|nr:hypothetical protein JTB14_011140 [Gonioctena quinquepunctata]
MDGIIGRQYVLRIKYEMRGETHGVEFFVKTLDESIPLLYDISREILAYEKEAFFYDTLIPLMKQQGLDCSYAPRSILCQPYTIVLENLATYSVSRKIEPLDYRLSKTCMEAMAKFHLGAILFERLRSKKMGKKYNFVDEFPILKRKMFTKDAPRTAKIIQFTIEGVCQVIDIIPEDRISRDIFKRNIEETLDRILLSPYSQEFRSIIIHGDVWSSNFLYLFGDNDEIKDCKLIDYQMVTYGPPTSDLLQFIFCNTRKEFRQQHQKNLFAYYYSYLTVLLRNKGISLAELMSESEFWKSCDISRIPAKFHAIVDRSFTFMCEKRFQEAARSEESFQKFLFDDRGKYILEEFKENKVYRDLLLEDISELKDMLFPL